MKRHLLVALSRSGWGETSLGANVARELVAQGDQATFIVHTKGVPALGETPCIFSEVSDETIPLLPLLFKTVLAARRYDSIILSDFLTTNYTMSRHGVDPQFLFKLGLPVLTLDTWDHRRTGSAVDVFGDHKWDIGNWIDQTQGRLIPVPIGRPDSPGAYSSLAQPARIGKSTRRHIRSNLNVGADDRAVLFCTAGWQHGPVGTQPKLAGLLPRCLGRYLAQFGPNVRLIHIGPSEIETGLNGQYVWMPPLRPTDFDRLLGSVDLLLSPNISATTIGKAVTLGVPVLTVKNSYAASSVAELENKVARPLAPGVRDWVREALPLYPFRMWPLGFWHFLNPLLEENPYLEAISTVELTDAVGFKAECGQLLYDDAVRNAMIDRQRKYEQKVRALPSAAQLVSAFLK